MEHSDLLNMKWGELKTERDSMVVAAGSRDKLSPWALERVLKIEARMKELVAAKSTKPMNKAKLRAKAIKRKKEPYSPDISKYMKE